VGKGRHIILIVGAIIVALLLLFPSWKAVHPNDPNLATQLGFAWAFSPPPPPRGFATMRVERDSLTYYAWRQEVENHPYLMRGAAN
jgi:hypothetical protein